jgi:hypothetical protein
VTCDDKKSSRTWFRDGCGAGLRRGAGAKVGFPAGEMARGVVALPDQKIGAVGRVSADHVGPVKLQVVAIGGDGVDAEELVHLSMLRGDLRKSTRFVGERPASRRQSILHGRPRRQKPGVGPAHLRCEIATDPMNATR